MNNQLPTILYKYKPIGPYTENLVLKGELYFPSIGQLNDPFEGSIPFIFDPNELTIENIYQYMRELAQKSHPRWTAAQIYNFVSKKMMEGYLFDEKHIEIINKETRTEVENIFGILSLTTDKENFLMWSHYADSHNGLCIGFNMVEILKKVKGTLGKVHYEEDLPVKHLKSETGEFIKNLLFTKSKVWEYENEYRLIKAGGSKEIIKIPLDSIVEVAFGCKVTQEEKTRLSSLIHSMNPNCKIFNISLSRKKFELETTELK